MKRRTSNRTSELELEFLRQGFPRTSWLESQVYQTAPRKPRDTRKRWSAWS